MIIYKGVSALSEFRRTKLLTRLQDINPSIQDVHSEYIHFVSTNGPLNDKEGKQLQKLLTYNEPVNYTEKGNLVLIAPRAGTISPWSTKATDIAKNCGLDKVERIERGRAVYITTNYPIDRKKIEPLLHDRMTEMVMDSLESAQVLFEVHQPRHLVTIEILRDGREALLNANGHFGLALSEAEIDYLYQEYALLKRNPTDAELMMFAQINSEHCRHKIFNADWLVDGKKQPKSLFQMIRNTYEKGGEDVLSAYADNAAVIKGPTGGRFFADAIDGTYKYHREPIHSVIKVETHNHPTAIAPFPGAATGSGGEIRDEGATGRGGKPKMGLSGYSVSNLRIPGKIQPWEKPYGKPDRIASSLEIMIDGPIGAASFNNEFGRPNLSGYFRTYEQEVHGSVYGYHKPIMIAGGLGNIRAEHVNKQKLPVGAPIIILGGPAMLIGLGGGAASSMQTGQSGAELDFASVQRANAEMQRRVQEVIDHCWAMGPDNPIISIHDVGAGGLCNALPELVHDSGLGGQIELRDIPNAEPSMSPREIWCNEAQERYVLGIHPKNLKLFQTICEREQCLFAVVGKTTKAHHLTVTDRRLKQNVVDLPLSVLFGKPPKLTLAIDRKPPPQNPESDTKFSEIQDIDEAVQRVLQIPSVGSKQFLITIGDRNVGGLLTRDQMIGPWQVPVSDVAVAASGFDTSTGEAMTMGERTPLAVINSPASARMAVGEAITNIAAASITRLSDIKLSANWMAAVGVEHENQSLYEAVEALGEQFCPELGLTIPVGKDSLSMRTLWEEKNISKSVTSPMSVIISAFSPVADIHNTLTPELRPGDTKLLLIDLGLGQNRLGGSALAQAFNQTGTQTPDADAKLLKAFFKTIQNLNATKKLLAYHDRSDGGLLTTLSEMAFASHCGLDINLETNKNILAQLFSEELGAVIQVNSSDAEAVLAKLNKAIPDSTCVIGTPTQSQQITFSQAGKIIYQNTRAQMQTWWSETSYNIQSLRDNPDCAKQEFQNILNDQDPGISPKISFDFPTKTKKYSTKPKVAIFRVQGVNGQVEMAAAFDRAGFSSVDVTLYDIMNNKVNLDDFVGLVACGGFSYGDVLGAGEGWAKSILFSPLLSRQFKQFFERPDTFTLGVCNGCQMLSALKELIPGAEQWPQFLRNESEQFEARLVRVKLQKSPSIFFKGMEGSILPVPVAHGEGRASRLVPTELIVGTFVDNNGTPTQRYPYNPNGSPDGITALTSPDGRATIMMPHPERAFLTQQLSWHPNDWQDASPWLQIFHNARTWVGNPQAK